MGISDRIEGSIEAWSQKWKARLGNWFAEFLAWGLELILDVIGKAFAPKLKPLIDLMEGLDIPPELKPLLDEMKAPTGEIAAMLGTSAGYATTGGLISSTIGPLLLKGIQYPMQNKVRQYLPPDSQIIAAKWRELGPWEELEVALKNAGYPDQWIAILEELYQVRLDPATITAIWLRDKDKYVKFWDDLKHQGWTPERIEVAKELAKIIPPLADMVRFADFGSFDPKIIELWREFYDAPSWISEPMSLLGITNEEGRDWANKYWFSHWRQPGRFELGEIYRRGLLGKPLIGQDEVGGGATIGPAEELVKNAYLTQGFSSFWQDHLLQLVREIPTRVDVRRWWDMRTIDEVELKSIYQRHGYFGKDLENYVTWTKVYVAFPDLIARWKNGWINLDDVRAELTGYGMPAARVEELIETKMKATAPERTANERELTKSDIYKGVKADQITREEGIDLLLDLGFDEDEADLLMTINVPEDVTDKVVTQRELTKTDIIKGLKAEVITEEVARNKLLELRYKRADAEFLLKIFLATIKPPPEPREREASKADIVLAVKKGLITPEDAYLMLQDIGFTPEASVFILAVRAESSPFSPINYAEFKDLTQKYRVASGMEVKPMPEEVKQAAQEVVRVFGEVESLKRSIADETRGIIDEEILPEAATARITELRVSLHRAEAELARLRDEYDSKVAEWRHGPAK